MPRKKKTEAGEPTSVLQPETEAELINPPTIEQSLIEPELEPESCSRNFLTATIQTAQTSISDLFEAQAQLAGTEIADKVFDSLEEAFVNRLQQRLQPFVSTLLPEIRDSHAELKQHTTARIERRLSAFDRLKQIATLVTDECRLSLPNGELTGNLLGFASWDVNHDQQENE